MMVRLAPFLMGGRDAGRIARLVCASLLFIAVAACAVRLAPEYDPSIVQGIEQANERAMVLFASVAQGVPARTFPTRAESYAEVIGKLSALRLFVKARPAPATPPLLGDAKLPEAPTEGMLEEAIIVITEMRQEDEQGGLNPAQARILKGRFEIPMLVIIKYEKMLQR